LLESIREKKMHVEGHATVLTTCFNIISNVVGGGVLLLPQAFKDASAIPGLIVLLFMGFLSTLSMFLMVLCAERTRLFTYKDLLTVAASETAARLFEVVLVIYPFGILVGWSRIIVDSMPPVARSFFGVAENSVVHQDWFWLIMAGLIFFPLSSMKSLAELKWSSIAGFATILYVGFVVVFRFFDGYYTNKWDPSHEFDCSSSTAYNVSQLINGTVQNVTQWSQISGSLVHPDMPWAHMDINFVTAFPMFSVAFSCHYNIPPFYAELRRRTPKRMLRAVGIAMPVITVFYVIIGLFGLLTFGDHVAKADGDIVRCYAWSDIPMNVARCGMFFHFCCVFPIVCIATRRAINTVIFGTQRAALLPHWILVVQAFLLVCASGILAYFVPGIGVVFTLNGAIFGLSIVLVLPAVFYLRLFPANRVGKSGAALLNAGSDNGGSMAGSAFGKDSSEEGPVVIGTDHDSSRAQPANSSGRPSSLGGAHGHDALTAQHFVESEENGIPSNRVSGAFRSSTGVTPLVRNLMPSDLADPDPLRASDSMRDTTTRLLPGEAHHSSLYGGAGDNGAPHPIVAESVQTPFDLKLQRLVRYSHPVLRALAWFNVVFGLATSVLSLAVTIKGMIK
jgi:amino acid permease